MAELIRELRRGRFLVTAVLYGVGAWLLLRISGAFAPQLGLQPDTVRLVLYLALIGFPLLLFSARLVAPSPAERNGSSGSVEKARKLVVLPFKQLRPDAETDFLSFSLADAVTCSLSGLPTLIVMSSAVTSRFSPDAPLERVASDVGADLILTGTLLRNGAELRVATQLVTMPGAAVFDSRTEQLPLANLFELQDAVARSVLSSLSLQEPREGRALDRDVPASGQAYQTYLRANQLAFQDNQWQAAADLYLKALAQDPSYAPAWARLGRIYRLLAKYADPRDRPEASGADREHYRISDYNRATLKQAEQSFARALELSPDLPLAHNLRAQLEVDLGNVRGAMVRLLERVRSNRSDPELYAGLVLTCRFAGLLQASVRAHERARALDPNAVTSVAQTYFMLGDYESALAEAPRSDFGFRGLVLPHLGRTDEAIGALIESEATATARALPFLRSLRSLLQGESREAHRILLQIDLPPDAEGLFYFARLEAYTGYQDQALQLLEESLKRGYIAPFQLERDSWLASLRSMPVFEQIVETSRAEHAKSLRAYQRAGGVELVGAEPRLPPSTLLRTAADSADSPSALVPHTGRKPSGSRGPLDVFISYDSADEEYAGNLYEYLTSHGVAAFFSKRSLPELSESDYIRAIHDALEQATHLVVVASSAERTRGGWVRSEWSLFYNEKLSGRKAGNLITIRASAFPIHELPIALRANQVVDLSDEGLAQLLRYVGSRAAPKPA